MSTIQPLGPTPRALLTAALVAALCSTNTNTVASGQTIFNTRGGDGGLVEQTCDAAHEQVRIDSESAASLAVCFGLTAPTGWIAVNITGSYGVVNNLSVPVSVAFKLPAGAVYYQITIPPGQTRSVGVDRRSTVVELQVSPVSTSIGASSGNLTPSSPESENHVSLRSAGRDSPGRFVRVSWAGMQLSRLDRNSRFHDRLDASFKVTAALDGSECVSLESATYPETYLTMDSTGSVTAAFNPDPGGATWCPTPAEVTPTGVHLAAATDQSRLLAANKTATVSTANTRTIESVWFTDEALAIPGK